MARVWAMVEACEASNKRRGQGLLEVLQEGRFSERELNYALLQAASVGQDDCLDTLIEAGATNISSASACAGYSGHSHIVDALHPRAPPIVTGGAFVGSLVGLRKELLIHVVQMSDLEGLDRCLLLGAARIWSCKTSREADFLCEAIEELAKAGARSFQTAIQVSCGDALIRYWNKYVFKDKIRILERIVALGARYLTAEFMSKAALMVCVTFFTKLIRLEERKRTPSHLGRKILHSCKGGDLRSFVPDIQDMISIISVLCKSGTLCSLSSDHVELIHAKTQDVMSSLQNATCSKQHGERLCECRVDWPLRMMRFLLVECEMRELSLTVTTLPVYQAARLNVLYPVVQCLLDEKCYEASYVYLDMAITFCQLEALWYLLSAMPRPRDPASMVTAVRSAASNTRGPPRGPQGVLLLMHCNFLDDSAATLAEAEILAGLPKTDETVKTRLREEWSQQAFEDGVAAGHAHFLTWMLLRKQSQSGFKELPTELQVAIGYLPLYRACRQTPGSLLSQRQRGELTTAVRYLYRGSGKVTETQVLYADKCTLLGLLAVCLPDWCQEVAACDDTVSLRTFSLNQ